MSSSDLRVSSNEEQPIELANVHLVLRPNCNLESLVCQLQPYCGSYLAVVNGTIRFYETLDDVPLSNRVLDHYGPMNECYIRDLDRNEMICCFDHRLINNMLRSTKSRVPVREPEPKDSKTRKTPEILHLNLDIVSANTIVQTLTPS